MIQAVIRAGRGSPSVSCGRRGCARVSKAGLDEPVPIGHLDNINRVTVLGLSLRWHWDGEAKRPRWRLGAHERPWQLLPRPPRNADDLEGRRLRMPYAGVRVSIDPDAHAPQWRIPLPAILECPRCGAVQEVASPPLT